MFPELILVDRHRHELMDGGNGYGKIYNPPIRRQTVNPLRKLLFLAGFILFVELGNSGSVGIFEQPIQAQTQRYRFCIVTRTPERDDPQQGGIQPASQSYYSELYQGPDRSKEFLAWLHTHYKKKWAHNDIPYRYAEDTACYLMSPENFSRDVKKLQSEPSKKPFNTFTTWPAETGDID